MKEPEAVWYPSQEISDGECGTPTNSQKTKKRKNPASKKPSKTPPFLIVAESPEAAHLSGSSTEDDYVPVEKKKKYKHYTDDEFRDGDQNVTYAIVRKGE